MSGLVIFVVIWFVIFLLDYVLKNYRRVSRSYKAFLEENGLSITFGHIRWYTTLFNRCFARWGKHYPRLVRVWFSAGVWFGLIMMVASVLVLTFTLLQAFAKTTPEQVLTPVMPGVNIPWSQIAYYLFTLTIAGAVHEMGHALAAVREQVRVNGFGMFFMVVYPGAFVDLYTEHLTVISPIRQLRIYCAGVWHNFILAFTAFGLLWFLPTCLSFGYVLNKGAVIFDLLEDSPIADTLAVGDYLTSVDNCAVQTVNQWRTCLQNTMDQPQHGFCTDMMTMIRKNSFLEREGYLSKSVEDCCGNMTASRFCFTYHSTTGQTGLSCLPARAMVSDKICAKPQDCVGGGEKVCIHPSLDNSSRLIRISHARGKDVLFVGDPNILFYSVTLVNYLPLSGIFPITLPVVVETMLTYIISLSGALALLNVAPCYWLDGQWVTCALMDYMFAKRIPDSRTRNTICNCVLTLGTLLLVSNVILALSTLVNVG